MVETTHIHDIIRVRGIRNYFNEFLSNCLAFSRSKFVNLPHCRQHCQINPRLRSSGIQASESKLRILVTSNAGFLESTSTESKLRNPSSKVLNPSRRRLLRLLRLHQLSTPASSHPPQPWLNGIQASNFGHINAPCQSVA